MAEILRMTFLFFIIGLIANFYEMSAATHIETVITMVVMLILSPEKYRP